MTTCETGAEMTSPSSTIANWFCGAGSDVRRVVTSRNSLVPSESNSRLTTHSFVTTPFCPTRSPEFAFEMSVPSTSTGPRMYLAEPSSAHETNAESVGPLSPPTRFSGRVQSSASNSACSSGVICARSLGFSGRVASASVAVVASSAGASVAASAAGSVASSAAGSVASSVAGSADSAAGSAFSSVAASSPVASSAGVAVGMPTARTGRNRIWAEVLTRSIVSWDGWPGMPTTILSRPWLVISVSETPCASMRWRMTLIAWLIVSGVTADASSVTGCRTICVPPSRSSASAGAKEAPPGLSAERPSVLVPAKSTPKRTTLRSRNRTIVRTGRERRVLELANCLSLLVRSAARPTRSGAGRSGRPAHGHLLSVPSSRRSRSLSVVPPVRPDRSSGTTRSSTSSLDAEGALP